MHCDSVGVGLMLVGALLALPGPALACGATPPPYYDSAEQGPSGQGVALNAPLTVRLEELQDAPADYDFQPRLTLIPAGDEAAIELRPLGSPPLLSWVPQESLAPETTYEAHFNPGYEGIPDTIWQFTTGATSEPTLALEGELGATLEPGMQALTECGACGNDCVETGEVPVTRARVKLPHAIGGFGPRFAELWLTDGKPYDFSPASKTKPEQNLDFTVSVPSYVDLDANTELLVTLVEEDQPYTPCFSLRATDARGDEALAEPFCLDRKFSAEEAAPTAGDDEAAPSSANSGCSVGPAAAPGFAWLVVLFAAGLLVRRQRKTLGGGSLSR